MLQFTIFLFLNAYTFLLKKKMHNWKENLAEGYERKCRLS